MTINPTVKMMRSLSNYSFEDLRTIAKREYVTIPEHISKIELITLIITNRVEKAISFVPDRTRYRFRGTDGTEHYVMLTPEQERFMRWNYDKAIDYDNIDIDVIEDIDWETP